jgi:hypothetical protein
MVPLVPVDLEVGIWTLTPDVDGWVGGGRPSERFAESHASTISYNVLVPFADFARSISITIGFRRRAKEARDTSS